MQFKLTPRLILFAVLCVCLTSEELWLRNALAFNTGRIVFTSLRDGTNEIYSNGCRWRKPRKPDKQSSVRPCSGLVS